MSNSRNASWESIRDCLKSSIPDSYEIVTEALELAGSECKIFVERRANSASVERLEGHAFDVNPHPQFLTSGKWSALNAKLLLIDGVIESVSEIDSILRDSNMSKQAVVLVARGFNNDVLSTLYVNHARKTLNVLPVIAAFDIETANVLLDIAIVAGCNVVSSLKGELISTQKFDSLMTVNDVICTGTSLTFNQTIDTHHAINAHVRSLIERRNKEKIAIVKQTLDKRLRSLSGSSVVIRFNDSGPHGAKVLNDIDCGLKITKNILKYGVLDDHTFSGMNEHLARDVIKGSCPTFTLAAGLKFALKTFESITSAGLFLGRFT
jgi:chaperonin GroEL (HSP60 family)